MTQLLHEFYAKRACGSKTRFENRERAAVVQSHDGFKLACYHCPVCHGWHLTKRGGRAGTEHRVAGQSAG